MASLPPVAPAATTTSPVIGKAIASAAALLPSAFSRLLDPLGGLDYLLGPGRALLLELALGGRESGVELILLAVEAALELVFEVAQGTAALASPTLGLVLERGQGPLAGPPRPRG